MKKVAENIFYAGAQVDGGFLFENQYEIPNGVTYNSYVILDEKTVVLDTADQRVAEQWLPLPSLKAVAPVCHISRQCLGSSALHPPAIPPLFRK